MKRGQRKDRRLSLVAVVLFMALGAVAGRLVILQGIQAKRYIEMAHGQRKRTLLLPARRGTVFDREGEVLAISEDVTTVYATPYQVKNKKRTARMIAAVLGEDETDIEKKLRKRCGFVYLARKLDNRVAKRIEKMRLEGIGFLEETKRLYPMGNLASQLLGVADMDNRGQSGLELYYERTLGGKAGEVMLEKDAAGNEIPGSERNLREASDGTDVRLTIDKDIQSGLEHALRAGVKRYHAKAATALVMDCNSGEVLAMASFPTFDPNDREDIDPAAMRNRAVTDVYEPGSALKMVTASAALEEQVVAPDTSIFVPSQLQVADRVFEDATREPARQMSFSNILSKSSNVGTIQVGLRLGKERLKEYIDRLGLGSKTGIDYPGEVTGIIPSLPEWTQPGLATISIGQGISVTPLQMACVAATVANGGRMVKPHLLSAKMQGGEWKGSGLGGTGERVLSARTCKTLASILETAVSPEGTGSKAAVSYYRVAGKTGTAAKPLKGGAGYGGTYMSTFVGFAPVEEPRLVALVVMDEPTPIWGGETSAPVFREIMELSLEHLKIPPGWGTQH